MGFTYNVLASIREQELKNPLKTTINRNIISGIAIFFVSTIFLLLGYTLYSINWTGFGHVTLQNLGLTPIPLDGVITKPLMQGFLFFDLVLLLYFINDFFSKKSHQKSQTV